MTVFDAVVIILPTASIAPAVRLPILVPTELTPS